MTIVKKTRLIENSLRDNYIRALNNPEFKELIALLQISDKEAMKYTSKLEDYLSEQKNCGVCLGLAECRNAIKGYTNYPHKYNDHLMFSCEACIYKARELKKKAAAMNYSKELNRASFATIIKDDKNRYKLIKWAANFIKTYDYNKNMKGLYLHGSFGAGKTYILSATFNELQKRGFSTEIVYFPELLRSLTGNFEYSNDMISTLCQVDLLLIDDIGAEKVTEWGRDEILGTILQSRMNNQKATFFTSNFTIKELENHLSCGGLAKVKANRIIERIKQLTEDMEIISENMRK